MPDTHNTTTRPTDSEQLAGGQGFPRNNPDGTPSLVGPDDYTKQIQMDRLNRGNTTVLGGNIADLQRIGEQVAGGPGTKAGANLSETLGAPPGVDPSEDNVVTAPQMAAARGEWDRETERTGLLDAPPEPTPAENKEANPVDPGNQSPTAESKGGGTKGASAVNTSTSASKDK